MPQQLLSVTTQPPPSNSNRGFCNRWLLPPNRSPNRRPGLRVLRLGRRARGHRTHRSCWTGGTGGGGVWKPRCCCRRLGGKPGTIPLRLKGTVFFPPVNKRRPPTAVGYSTTAVGYSTTAVSYSTAAVGYSTTAVGYLTTAVRYSTAAIDPPPTDVDCHPTVARQVPSNGVPQS